MGRPLESEYPYRSKEYDRNKNLIAKYGITLKEWNSRFTQQGEMCAICTTKEPGGKNWHTDHNHKTGQVRSILCSNCNSALGKFNEDPTTLVVAAIYSLIWNYRDKGGKEDLEKAIHNLQILMELEYGKESGSKGPSHS